MPKFNVRFTYLMVCETKGYTIEAATEEEAAEKAAACITEDSFFDLAKFEAVGGNSGNGSWGTLDGTDYNYDFDEDSTEEETA